MVEQRRGLKKGEIKEIGLLNFSFLSKFLKYTKVMREIQN
jgi:hypothetical protein